MHAPTGNQYNTGNVLGVASCGNECQLPTKTMTAQPDRSTRCVVPNCGNQGRNIQLDQMAVSEITTSAGAYGTAANASPVWRA